MRLVIRFMMILAPAIVNGQKYKYFDENAEEVSTKEDSYYYQQIVPREKGKCLILEFYSSDDSKKREAECEEGVNVMDVSKGFDVSVESIRKTEILKGLEMNYREGGVPWYSVIWGTHRGYLFAQYWVNRQPQLYKGTGTVKLEDEDGNVEVADFRDSTMFCRFKVNNISHDSLYSDVEEPAYYSEDYNKLQNDVDKFFANADKGGETGTLCIDFIIDKHGNVSDIEICDGGIGPVTTKLIDNKFVSLGKWHPAKVNGKPVKSTHREFVDF